MGVPDTVKNNQTMNQLLFSYLGFDLKAEEVEDLKGSCEPGSSKGLQKSFDRALQIYAESRARAERIPELPEGVLATEES
jgi:hypothetical protein